MERHGGVVVEAAEHGAGHVTAPLDVEGVVVGGVARAVAIPVEVGEDAILEAEVGVERYGREDAEGEALLDEGGVGGCGRGWRGEEGEQERGYGEQEGLHCVPLESFEDLVDLGSEDDFCAAVFATTLVGSVVGDGCCVGASDSLDAVLWYAACHEDAEDGCGTFGGEVPVVFDHLAVEGDVVGVAFDGYVDVGLDIFEHGGYFA